MPEITIHTDGPYVVDASGLEIKDAGGGTVALPAGSKVALCRCGQSQNKPFCDGAHKAAGFQHDPSAS